ncbi:hypothetical protein CDAR_44811 [Caerostris darwini]|uniref:Uncharacterized protein n=1 Tax=Caerostris darwini TaxID=1538125 RepID=A0AAV4SN82_9ARAC|nr:hypothetical protein CDAR_44811 [Caerostris darwini]
MSLSPPLREIGGAKETNAGGCEASNLCRGDISSVCSITSHGTPYSIHAPHGCDPIRETFRGKYICASWQDHPRATWQSISPKECICGDLIRVYAMHRGHPRI